MLGLQAHAATLSVITRVLGTEFGFLGLCSKHFADLAVSTTLQLEQRLAGARMASEQVRRCTQQGPRHTEPRRMLWKDAQILVTLAGVPEHLESALHMERHHAGHASQERFRFWLIACY